MVIMTFQHAYKTGIGSLQALLKGANKKLIFSLSII